MLVSVGREALEIIFKRCSSSRISEWTELMGVNEEQRKVVS